MLSVLLLAAALTGGATPATPSFPAARSLVPYVKHQEVDELPDWTMHDAKEKWIRGGIGHGDGEPVFHLVDAAFDAWSDSEEHAIEVSVGDPARRVPATAWAGNAGGQTPGSVGFRMNADLRKLIGGATSVQI